MVVLTALIPVILGTLFGLTPWISRPLLGPMRTLALMAALTVVFADLLPESVEAIGGLGLVVFFVGLVGPIVMEKAMRWLGRRAMGGHGLALELGYLGLLLHQGLDGAQIAAASHLDGQAGVVTFAVAAHATPLVLVTVLGYAAHDGLRAAVFRALGLAFGTVMGVASITFLGPWMSGIQPWLAAGIAGVLLNILVHDLASDLPRTAGARAGDLVAAIVGVVVPLVILPHHHDGAGPAGFLELILIFSYQVVPMLLGGLLLGAIFRSVANTTMSDGGLSSLLGRVAAPLPVCVCDIVPTGRTLSQRSIGAGFVVALLVAIPGLGLETLTITVALLGWPFALMRVCGVLLLAMVAGVVVGSMVNQLDPVMPTEFSSTKETTGFLSGVARMFDEAMLRVAPWITLGIVVAAYVFVHLPTGQLDLIPTSLHFVVMSIVSFPVYVCAASATPLAAVLLSEGLSPGAAMMGLLLGPAVNVVAVSFLLTTYGRRATWVGLGTLISAAFLVSLGAEYVFSEIVVAAPQELANPMLRIGAQFLTAIASVFVLRSLWHRGIRGWVIDLLATAGGVNTRSEHRHGNHHEHHEEAAY